MSSVQRILAVLPFAKFARHALHSPDLLPRPLGVLRKVDVSLVEMAVDRFLRRFDRRVVAVVNDSSGHSAKYRFDHVQELCSRRQCCSFHDWSGLLIELFQMSVQLLRDVPGGRVPREIDRAASMVLITARDRPF